MSVGPAVKQIAQKVFDSLTDSIRVNVVAGSSSANIGRTVIAKSFVDYTMTPVTTSVYKEIVTSLSDDVNRFQIFDGSGQVIILATGGSGSEVDLLYIQPGGDSFDVFIASGTRVSIKALTASAADNFFIADFLK